MSSFSHQFVSGKFLYTFNLTHLSWKMVGIDLQINTGLDLHVVRINVCLAAQEEASIFNTASNPFTILVDQ